MSATRLAMTGIAAGAMVLGLAGPALATPAQGPVHPGAYCDTLGDTGNTVKGTPMVCKPAKDGKLRWQSAKPGDGEPSKSPKPTPTPTKPAFKFGDSKVKLSTLRVVPGGKTTFTVTCPSTVSITSNGYTRNPLPVKKAGKSTWTATGTFRSSLPDPTTATVVCKGFGSVKFSTSPEKGGNTMKPKKPKIPVGRIDTGDGSMYGQTGGSAAPLLAAGWGALMAAGLGAIALRRRTARGRS